MGRWNQTFPSLIALAVLVALWWLVVRVSDSAIFPTPWQVVTGAGELAASAAHDSLATPFTRHASRAHGVAGFDSTTTVSCPLACAVQAKG